MVDRLQATELSEDEFEGWKSRFKLISELREKMNPLFQVMFNNSVQIGRVGTTYWLVIPTTLSTMTPQDVRTHIFLSKMTQSTLTGLAGGSTATLDNDSHQLAVRRGETEVSVSVSGIFCLLHRDGVHRLYFLIVDQPLTPSAPVKSTRNSRRSLWYSVCRSHQPNELASVFEEEITQLPINQTELDPILMSMDTELSIFMSSYICVKGFERFTTAKVNQIAESVVEQVLELLVAEDVAASSDDSIDEDTRELVIVSFHTLVTERLASSLVPHWRVINEVEDYAFHHACCSLSRSLDQRSCWIDAGLPSEKLPEAGIAFESAVAMLHNLESPHGVLVTLRFMEIVIDLVVECIGRTNACEVTADVCIPFMVFVIAQAKLEYLHSTMKYVDTFMIGVFESSSLCYAFTTFEAACAQLLHEYSAKVMSQE